MSTIGRSSTAAAPTRRQVKPRILDVAQLSAPVFLAPLTIAAENYGILTRDYRLYLVSIAGLIALIALSRALGRIYNDQPLGVSVSMVIGTLLFHGNQISASLPFGIVSVIAIFAVFLVAVRLMNERAAVVTVVSWLAVAMWLWAGAAWVEALIDGEPSGLEAWESDVPELTAATRDVVILLMDEYPNGEFLDSIGAQEASVVGWLDDSGFDTDGSIWSTYAFTELALPAFFLLQPPLEAGDRVTESLRGELAGMAGGENPVVRSFNNAGYRTWMVESGWSGLRCMPTIDECIRRSWYDEGMALLLSRSLIADLSYELMGSPFSHGVERTFAWIRTELPRMLADDARDLVIIHLMVPHAPLAFSRNCERLRSEQAMAPSALVEQVHCANRVIREVASTDGKAPIVLVLGDHGTQLLGQTKARVSAWDEAMVAERMMTLSAIRGIETCEEPPPNTTLNALVRLMRCLGGDVEYAPDIALVSSVFDEPLVDVYSAP